MTCDPKLPQFKHTVSFVLFSLSVQLHVHCAWKMWRKMVKVWICESFAFGTFVSLKPEKK